MPYDIDLLNAQGSVRGGVGGSPGTKYLRKGCLRSGWFGGEGVGSHGINYLHRWSLLRGGGWGVTRDKLPAQGVSSGWRVRSRGINYLHRGSLRGGV